MVGVARAGLHVGQPDHFRGSNCWLWWANGAIKGNEATGWPGQQKFAVSDTLGVLLDCGAGSLTMYKNGARLGVAVANGVQGDLHWAVCLNRSTVRLTPKPLPAGV
jgi:hypothetical protein